MRAEESAIRRPLVLLAIVAISCLREAAHRAPSASTGSVSGAVELADGLAVAFAYDYDRNALVDSRVAGDALIALTRAGHLLRFSVPDLRFERESISALPLTSLGEAGGAILAGRSDGVVFRVDPADLRLTPVSEFSGEVAWVGSYDGDDGEPIYVAVARGVVEESGRDSKVRRWEPPHSPHVLHLDRERQLWIGTDDGEFGGQLARIDLRSGEVHDYFAACRATTSAAWAAALHMTIEELWKEWPYTSGCDGVYGFVELESGEVWAYGGVSHMGSNRGFIARLGADSLEIIGEFGTTLFEPREEPPRSDRPRYPITHILERSTDALILHAYGVVTTLRDGVVRITGDTPSYRALADQLGVVRARRIESTVSGLIVIDGQRDCPVWRLDGKRWVSMTSDVLPDYADRPGSFVAQSGSPIAVFEHSDVWKLDYGRYGNDLRVIRTGSTAPLKVHAGLSLGNREVLIATSEGLRKLNLDREELEAWGRELALPDTIRALARDGSGRIWFAGGGLWLRDERGAIHDLSSVSVARSDPSDLIADPSDPRGVVIALGERGVLRVRAEAPIR
jgi:hypothetical protein